MFLLWVLPVVLFFPSLLYFFVQDDFYLLSISHASSLYDALHLFVPLSEVVWYRPLSSQVFFFLGKLVFDSQPFWFHLIVLCTHLATIYMLVKFLASFSLKKISILIGALFYAVHQAHVVALSWLAAYSFVLGPMLLLTFFYMYRQKRMVSSYLIFILGLLTTEVFIVALPLLLLYMWILERKIKLKVITFFSAVIVFLIGLRFWGFPTTQHTNLYETSLGVGTFSVVKFYLLRIIGIPLAYPAMPHIMRVIILVSIFMLMIAFFFSVKNQLRKFVYDRRSIFFLLWFLICLSPFFALPNHLAPHYATFTLLGAASILAISIDDVDKKLFIFKKKYFVFMFCVLFVTVHFIGAAWMYQTHWLFRRAKLAQKLVKENDLLHDVGSEEYFASGGDNAYRYYTNK